MVDALTMATLGYKSPTQFMHDWIMIQHERKLRHDALSLEDGKPRECRYLTVNQFLARNCLHPLILGVLSVFHGAVPSWRR